MPLIDYYCLCSSPPVSRGEDGSIQTNFPGRTRDAEEVLFPPLTPGLALASFSE